MLTKQPEQKPSAIEQLFQQILEECKDETVRIRLEIVKHFYAHVKSNILCEILGEDKFLNRISTMLNIPIATISEMEIPEETLRLIPREVAQKHHIIPISKRYVGNEAFLRVAMVNPQDQTAIEDIKFLTGINTLDLVLITEIDFKKAFEKNYPPDSSINLDDILKEQAMPYTPTSTARILLELKSTIDLHLLRLATGKSINLDTEIINSLASIQGCLLQALVKDENKQ